MMKRIIAVVVAVVLAASGTFLLTSYVRGAESRALAGEQVVSVLVVRDMVPQGTPAEAIQGSVEQSTVPAKVRAEGSVENLDGLTGRVAAVDLLPGEQVLTQRFVDPVVLRQDQVDVPEGLLQVTVQLEPQRALGGMLSAGDRVGVVASFTEMATDQPEGDQPAARDPATHLILHKVLVSRVQGGARPAAEADEDDGAASGAANQPVLVTLAIDPGAVERVVFAAEHGTLWLTAQPENAREDGVRVQTKGTIYE